MTKNQGFGRLSRLRDVQQDESQSGETPAPSPVLPDLEMPELPALSSAQREATKLLSAQVPVARKLAFDRHVLDAKQYYPDLEMREGVTALIALLDDERVRRLWLHEIQKLR